MPRNTELLLVENVENLGIVGDIARVKTGYARNYLLPMGLAEFPTEAKIEALKERRAAALSEVQELRSAREELLGRMEEVTIRIERNCNDQGVLYGSITQRDIADTLQEDGYNVGTRSIRLKQPLRRIGDYHVAIQFEKDLRTEITVEVASDRPLGEEREEMEFDDEGNLVSRPEDRPKGDQKKQQPEGEESSEESDSTETKDETEEDETAKT